MPVWVVPAFFLVALAYSIAGFAGGSSYLALLVIAGLDPGQIPVTALLCNIVVSAGTFHHFRKANHFRFRLVLPFTLLSVPMAYWGGTMLIGRQLFALLLGGSLLAVAVRLLIEPDRDPLRREISAKAAWSVGLPVGALLGFLSGLVGIGGGIFLSPLLLLLRWASPQEAAASAGFFILVNSSAGILGQLHKGGSALPECWPFAIAVFLGGQIGAGLGARAFSGSAIRRTLAGIVFYASVKMLAQAL